MKSTTKKNLLAGLLIVASVVLLVVGVFSFFSDRGDANAVATAGTVKITVENKTDPDDLKNINPGDHDWDLATYLGYTDWAVAGTSITDGSLHPIALSVENTGNKSVKIRNSIDLLIDFDDDDYVIGDEFMFFLATEADRTATGAAELEKKYYLFKDGSDTLVTLLFTTGVSDGSGYYVVNANDEPVDTTDCIAADLSTCIGIRYIVFDADPANGYILQGVGANAEAEPSDGIEADANPGYTYYLGLKAGADNRYQGATIDITWSVEAIQHRNTDSTNAWTKVGGATASGKVPAWNEDATGNELITP